MAKPPIAGVEFTGEIDRSVFRDIRATLDDHDLLGRDYSLFYDLENDQFLGGEGSNLDADAELYEHLQPVVALHGLASTFVSATIDTSPVAPRTRQRNKKIGIHTDDARVSVVADCLQTEIVAMKLPEGNLTARTTDIGQDFEAKSLRKLSDKQLRDMGFVVKGLRPRQVATLNQGALHRPVINRLPITRNRTFIRIFTQ